MSSRVCAAVRSVSAAFAVSRLLISRTASDEFRGQHRGGRHRLVDEVAGLAHAIDEAQPCRLLAEDRVPAEGEPGRSAVPAPCDEEVRRRELRDDAELHEPDGDLRLLGGEDLVERQHHRDADADRGPVQRREQRLGGATQPDPVPGRRPHLTQAGISAGEHRLHVGTGAEPTSGPGDDDGADRRIVVGGRDRIGQLPHHARRPHVQLLRAVEREEEHPIPLLARDLLVGVSHGPGP